MPHTSCLPPKNFTKAGATSQGIFTEEVPQHLLLPACTHAWDSSPGNTLPPPPATWGHHTCLSLRLGEPLLHCGTGRRALEESLEGRGTWHTLGQTKSFQQTGRQADFLAVLHAPKSLTSHRAGSPGGRQGLRQEEKRKETEPVGRLCGEEPM